jgi:hypothetical protein
MAIESFKWVLIAAAIWLGIYKIATVIGVIPVL